MARCPQCALQWTPPPAACPRCRRKARARPPRREGARAVAGKTCPYCQTPFEGADGVVVCSACRMPHHRDCWAENGGCTTYGCTATRAASPPAALHGGPPFADRIVLEPADLAAEPARPAAWEPGLITQAGQALLRWMGYAGLAVGALAGLGGGCAGIFAGAGIGWLLGTLLGAYLPHLVMLALPTFFGLLLASPAGEDATIVGGLLGFLAGCILVYRGTRPRRIDR